MVKSKSKSPYKETFLYCNLLIFAGLIALYYYLNKPIKEGIRNMNCCGGVEAGIHYSETDTKPPSYIRKCFKSSEDGSYQWSGFPCTNKGSNECCNGEGDCIPTIKGGYCSAPDNDFVFRNRSDQSRPYIKHRGDEILDINDANNMKDYFYDRGEKGKSRGTSTEMRRFLARRGKNEEYMEQHLRDKRKSERSIMDASNKALGDQSKGVEIITWITIIHLLFLVSFSIVIREEVIQKIDGFYTLLYVQYLNFTGKTI